MGWTDYETSQLVSNKIKSMCSFLEVKNIINRTLECIIAEE